MAVGPERVRLWDPALRLFHWVLAAAVITSYVLGEFGPSIMTLHFWSGYLICALLGFRLIWGVFGPRPARFASFLAGPKTIAAYVRHLGAREPSYWPGHNPLGGWAVVAMLCLLLAQVTTGLLADPDDFINVGPLAHLVEPAVNRQASVWHDIIATALVVMVVLHVGVIVFYRLWKREDLIGPMIHGWKRVRRGSDEVS